MRHIFGILLICSATLSMLAQNSTPFTRLQFDDPPEEFRPMPLWFINGELTEEGILKQMEDARYEAGFIGVAPLPMVSTKPDVLSEAYFQRYEFILETAKNLGKDVIQLIIFDDVALFNTRSELMADVRFTPEPEVTDELGLFSYLHKVRNGNNIYFFANSSDLAVDTEVLLKGKLKLENWDPHTGSTSQLAKVKHIRKDGEIFTQCLLNLKTVHSIFWIKK